MKAVESLSKFETKKGQEYYFVKHIKGGYIQVWKVTGHNEIVPARLDLLKKSISADVLKESDAWDALPSKIQEAIIENDKRGDIEIINKMAHARKKRKKKYDFSKFPEYLTCKCGREIKANYYALQKKADAQTVPITDLIDGYQCQKCNPTKRKRKKK
jgi:hypothetical protein